LDVIDGEGRVATGSSYWSQTAPASWRHSIRWFRDCQWAVMVIQLHC